MRVHSSYYTKAAQVIGYLKYNYNLSTPMVKEETETGESLEAHRSVSLAWKAGLIPELDLQPPDTMECVRLHTHRFINKNPVDL